MAFLKKYCTEIETVMLDFDFLSCSKKHRVSRNTLKRPKSHGGFNLYSVRDIELALNVKMIYKLLMQMLKYGIRLVHIIYRILIVNTILDISCAHARFYQT